MVSPLTADLLDHPALSHGFFTREGGVSGGIFASLNCGFGAEDDAAAVRENRLRCASALGGHPLVTVFQKHTPQVVTVEDPWPDDAAPVGDAMVSRAAGVSLGVLAADCAPVLFADPGAGVIGAAHAGWRGALDGVIEATVHRMEALGAAPRAIRAAIGPSIGPASYEVGEEFRARFLERDADTARYFAPGGTEGKHLFDLPAYVLARLERAGVGSAAWIGHDTLADPERFFSYRRACHRGETDYGRLLSAIALAP